MALATAALGAPAPSGDPLWEGFKDPPASARPRVWWHWLNGNITIDGIDKDLDWMHRIGIGGVQNFDANLMTPQIVEKRLVYMTPEWKAAFRHAVARANSLGLEFAIASSPGWSETGGPWVMPPDAMKKLVWSETVLKGGARFSGKLADLPATAGPYQSIELYDPLNGPANSQTPLPRWSHDIAVIAVPLAAPPLPLPEVTTGTAARVDAASLSDDDLDHGVVLATAGTDRPSIILSYARPVTIRSARFFAPQARPPFGDAAILPVLEAEGAGGWQRVADFPILDVPSVASFAPVTARRFRVVLGPNTRAGRPLLGAPAPGAEMINIFPADAKGQMTIGDLRLSNEATLADAPLKAAFGQAPDYSVLADDRTAAGVAPERMIDLTSRMRTDGTINWTAPRGSAWRIYRFGASLTGKTNHPASPEATGLEVDKYDAAAVERYLDSYLGHYRDALGAPAGTLGGLGALLTDSIEAGASNWTPGMFEDFKAARGYDARPWLPALAGVVIQSPAQTERFLYDYRQTLAELMSEAHYATIARVAHANGLKVYGEALEDGRPVLGDDMAMRRHTDVPMAALWAFARGEKPRPTLLGDMRGAASVAHVYGQNIVAAESMTAAFSPWAFAPSDLKRIIDLELVSGINRPVIHTSVHVPVDDRKPGLSLAIFGQYFNRNENWAEMAKPWIDYIARSSFLLQQGHQVADIAYFYGEDTPLTSLFEGGIATKLPRQRGYDFVNADALKTAIRVEGGALVSTGGTRYAALYLGGTSAQMTLGTLERIAALADAGALIMGPRPVASPSLADNPQRFAALVNRLWSSGRVVDTSNAEEVLGARGIGPDFRLDTPDAAREIAFLHRTSAADDIYFIANQENRSAAITAHFRVTGKQPELWDAVAGNHRRLSYRTEGSETAVQLDLAAEQAVFVVFRKATTAQSVSIPLPVLEPITTITHPWTVSFQPGRGARPAITLEHLAPLNLSADPGVRYFSGVATYRTDFDLPAGTCTGQSIWLDLGTIGDIAEVKVNGRMAGTSWIAPYRLDVAGLTRHGTNTLEIRVANLWVNRLIGDKQPDARPITFTTVPTYRADAPLRPSGLIGPVRLLGSECISTLKSQKLPRAAGHSAAAGLLPAARNRQL